jgi:peptide/nickel transport system ATP-binding protein
MAASTDLLVGVQDLSVSFVSNRQLSGASQALAVADVTLGVRRGETLCVVGESGSGKTTLARAIGRLVRPSAGKVSFDGINVGTLHGRKLRLFRSRVQFVFQDPYESLNPRQRIGDIVAEPLLIHGAGRTKAEIRDRVIETLDECGLSPGASFAHRYPHELSGGQRQRVCIASATVLRPELLIADEPVSMLDVSVRAGVIRLLLNLRQTHDMTLVFITHDLSLAWAIGDRVAVMYAGRLMELGTPEEVVVHPAHPYTSALVAAIPVADPHQRLQLSALKGEGTASSGCAFRLRCAYAVDACSVTDPDLVSIGDQHLTACLRHSELVGRLQGATSSQR